MTEDNTLSVEVSQGRKAWGVLGIVTQLEKGKFREAAHRIMSLCEDRAYQEDRRRAESDSQTVVAVLNNDLVRENAVEIWAEMEHFCEFDQNEEFKDILIATLHPYWSGIELWRPKFSYAVPLLVKESGGLYCYPKTSKPTVLVTPGDNYRWFIKREKAEAKALVVIYQGKGQLPGIKVTTEAILHGFGRESGLSIHAALKEGVWYNSMLLPIRTGKTASACA